MTAVLPVSFVDSVIADRVGSRCYDFNVYLRFSRELRAKQDKQPEPLARASL
jgi:hypothetical protein